MVVFATNMAMAQKEVTTTPTVNSTPIEAAQVKTHSNTNNNREAGSAPKAGGAVSSGTGASGTKKKFDLGKFLKKK